MELLEQKEPGVVRRFATFSIGVLIITFVGWFLVLFVQDYWRDGQYKIAQASLNNQVSKTDAGRFAVENFSTCKHADAVLGGPRSDAECITETVNGARTLRGEAFGAQVTQALAGWFDDSKKIRPSTDH